jgi:hypothetical protein
MSDLFSFDPNTSDAPLPRGRQEVEIIAAQPRVSRAGNPMLDLTYRATGEGGDGEVILKDYLVSTPRSKWKIKRFCQALGLDFEAGAIDPALVVGRRLTVEIGIEDDGQGRDRNVVNDYVAAFQIGQDTTEGVVGRWRSAMGQADHHEPPASPRRNARGTNGAVMETDAPRRAKNEEGEDIPF